MGDLQQRIDDLADLMNEFGLERVRLKGEDWSVEFSRIVDPVASQATLAAPLATESPSPTASRARAAKPAPEEPQGTPVTSPMMGIFYGSPSPGAPAYAKPGDAVTAGQVVGLIEAMKVFNEITAPVSGRVLKVCVDSGALVQPGDPLLTIG